MGRGGRSGARSAAAGFSSTRTRRCGYSRGSAAARCSTTASAGWSGSSRRPRWAAPSGTATRSGPSDCGSPGPRSGRRWQRADELARDRARAELTILHVSDPQFGAHHLFGGNGLTPRTGPRTPCSGGCTRIWSTWRTSTSCGRTCSWSPATWPSGGCAASSARLSEFLGALSEAAEIPRRHVAIVPGNHDVNRRACAGLLRRSRRATRPSRSRRTGPSGATSPRLSTTSTPACQRHVHAGRAVDAVRDAGPGRGGGGPELHHGGKPPRRRPLRLGRRSTSCTGSPAGWPPTGTGAGSGSRPSTTTSCAARCWTTRTSATPTTWTGSSASTGLVNLLLHGHTPRRQAALAAVRPAGAVHRQRRRRGRARPAEVPNQYQLITVRRDGFTRYARQYAAGQRRWIGDNRISPTGSDWRDAEPHPLTAVDTAFPRRSGGPGADEAERRPAGRRGSRTGRRAGGRPNGGSPDGTASGEGRPGGGAPGAGRRGHPRPVPRGHRDRAAGRRLPAGIAPDAAAAQISSPSASSTARRPRPQSTRSSLGCTLGSPQPIRRCARSSSTRALRRPASWWARAAQHGVRLRSLIEYQGLLDLRPLAEAQTGAAGGGPDLPSPAVRPAAVPGRRAAARERSAVA